MYSPVPNRIFDGMVLEISQNPWLQGFLPGTAAGCVGIALSRHESTVLIVWE